MLDQAEYASAALTDADKGTIAILSTLDKLDRQIEALSTEITSCVTLSALSSSSSSYSAHEDPAVSLFLGSDGPTCYLT